MTKATLLTLAKRMTKLADDLPERASRLAADTAYEIITELVSAPPKGTPVDTTFAESNWTISLAGISSSMTLGAIVPGSKGSTQAASAEGVKSRAVTALQKKKPGQTIYISNVAPYIRKLAYEGHSKQSPPGWVEAAVLLGRLYVRKARARLISK